MAQHRNANLFLNLHLFRRLRSSQLLVPRGNYVHLTNPRYQGVMGGVNAAPYFVTEVGTGTPNGNVTKTATQGGIVSIYYWGCTFGCFVGGWAADRIVRINGIFYACFFAVIEGALQAATQCLDFILIAGVITGTGTGPLTGNTPLLISEVSASDYRGGFLGYVSIINYLGISVAYWLSFGLAFMNN
jgi:MFS family permease